MRPSAPLFPLPTTTTTVRPYRPPIIRFAVRATAAPARPINTSIGVPAVTVSLSRTRICLGVRTGRIELLLARCHGICGCATSGDIGHRYGFSVGQ